MPATQDDVIFREKVRFEYSLLPVGMSATLINCTIVTILHWHLVPHHILLSWTITLLSFSLLRLVFYLYFRRVPVTNENSRFRQKLFSLSIVLLGTLWGSAALLSLFHNSEPHRLLIAYVIGGMIAGVAGTFAAFRFNYYGFTLPAILPQLIVFLLIGTPIDLAMAGMFALFVVLLSILAEANNRIIDTSMRLRSEKDDLIVSLYKEKQSAEDSGRQLRDENERRRQSEAQLQAARNELEQKVAERTAELSAANTDLARSEAVYRSIIETSQEGIWVISPRQRISYANRRMAQLLGYRLEDLIDQDLSRFVVEQDLVYYAAEMEISGVRQVRLRCRRGKIIPVLEAASELPLPIGRDGRLLCMVTDITELSEREEQIRRYARMLEERNRELDAFTHSVSHDLRSPLLTIMGFSRLLNDDYGKGLPPTANQYLQHIISGTEKMHEIIDDLLKLSRVARLEVARSDVDLSRIAATILAELKKSAPQRHVRIHIQPGLRCAADPGLLTVALTNLLSNAWKYTQKTPQAAIEVGSHLDERGSPVFFVKDNGVGFDMAHAERLFQPFQRLHAETEFSGTGIGLVIADRVIKKHGGRIWAESAPGQGATFFFTLG